MLSRRIRSHPHWALALVLCGAAWLRFHDLGSWPAFGDEDIYTRITLEMRAMPLKGALAHSADVGKTPLAFVLHWAASGLVEDPIVAGRAIAAVSGVATVALCYLLGFRFGGARAGLLTAAIYAVAPLAVLHERMVLQDGPMAAASLASALSAWTAIERGSWRRAALAAMLGALAVQLKVPGVGASAAPVLGLVGLEARAQARRAGIGLLAFGAPVLSYLLLMSTPLGPGLRAASDDLSRPFQAIGPNLLSLADSGSTYFPNGLLLVAGAGALLLVRSEPRAASLVLGSLAGWTLPWVLLSRFTPSRYFLPAVPYVCLLIAIALVKLPAVLAALGRGGQVAALAGGALLVLLMAGSAVHLVVQHRDGPLSHLDDLQYRSGWPAGYGYPDAAAFVRAHVTAGASVGYLVGPEHQVGAGLYRPLPPGVRSLGLLKTEQLASLCAREPVYLLVDDGREGDDQPRQRVREVVALHPGARELARFTRPGALTGVSVLRLDGSC